MALLYKMTYEDDRTGRGCQWGAGIEHTAPGVGPLAGPGWLYAYTHPLLAVFFNRIHVRFEQPHLWVADGDIGKTDHGIQVACRRLATVRRIEVPTMTGQQCVGLAVLATREVSAHADWLPWARRWLDDSDTSRGSALRAMKAVWRAAWRQPPPEQVPTFRCVPVPSLAMYAEIRAAEAAAWVNDDTPGIDREVMAEWAKWLAAEAAAWAVECVSDGPDIPLAALAEAAAARKRV